MVAIRLTAFQGEMPRVTPRLLPNVAATAAINCRLEDGSLGPIRRPNKVADLGISGAKTIFKHRGAWLAWSVSVHAAPGPVDDTRLYFTGDGEPKMRKDADVFPLAVPRPAGALTPTLGGAGSGDTVTRVYVYTWVTGFGEESEPNPASAPIDWKPGNTVTLSGFGAAPAGRNITAQRIYRSQTGKSGTYFYLIAERAAAAADYIDSVPVDAFQEPLPSADWNAPPDTLRGLVAMPNGMMAAFAGRRLYFCEPFRPHAWPEKYALTTDADIVGLAALDRALIIMTEANPYIAIGSTPATMQMDKLEANWPCVNARGIVDLGYAACYPTHEGLVSVRADGACALASAALFSREDWQRLAPSTLVAGQLSGRYVAFFDTIAANGEVFAGSVGIDIGEAPFLVRTANRASAVYFDVGESALYFVPSGSEVISRFDAPEAALERQYWRSKEFVLPYPVNFGAIQVDIDDALSLADRLAAEALRDEMIAANGLLLAAGPVDGEMNSHVLNAFPLNGDILAPLPGTAGSVTVGVIADGRRVADIRTTNRATRLKGGFKARKWEIDVAGDLSVTSVVMGETMDDISATP